MLDEIKKQAAELLRHAPDAKKISSIQSSRSFKDAAKKVMSAKKIETAKSALANLRSFYQ